MYTVELENEKYIYTWVGVRMQGVVRYIYIYIYERIEVLNKKEVKFFLYCNYERKLINNIEINY